MDLGIEPTSAQRRSARQTRPSKKLSDLQLLAQSEDVDAADDDQYAFLRAPQDARDEIDADEEESAFEEPEEGETPSSSDENYDRSFIGDDDFDEHQSGRVYGEGHDAGHESNQPHVRFKDPLARKARKGHEAWKIQNRGARNAPMRNSKVALYMATFGPAREDQEPAQRAEYRWRYEPTLPSRKADNSGAGGYHRTFYHQDEDRKREMVEDWKWWDVDGGKEYYARQQKSAEITAEEAQAFLRVASRPLKVVAGAIGSQQCFDMAALETLHLDRPFTQSETEASTTCRSGWYIHAGGRVQTVSWAPNQASTQYIALSVLHLHDTALNSRTHSSFQPQQAEKSAIQIWEIQQGSEGHVDKRQPPRLCQVIGTNFGDIRAIRWCPSPRRPEAEELEERQVGLIAGVWGDGTVRVIKVVVPSPGQPIRYSHVMQTAFAARPMKTVFSCVTWLSSHGLAAGTSTGSVAVFSLSRSAHREHETTDAVPVLEGHVQSSYITDIKTCYPSRPQMLMTSSMSGQLSLTDLSRVSTSPGFSPSDTVYSLRMRMGRAFVAWHDWSQLALSADENNVALGSPIRRFFTSIRLTRTHSPVTTVAVSECHPCVAFGGTGGDVTFTNPTSRVLTAKTAMKSLRWFVHSWRATKPPQIAPIVRESWSPVVEVADKPKMTTDENHGVEMESDKGYNGPHDPMLLDESDITDHPVTKAAGNGPDGDIGIVRITESFKVEEVTFASGAKSAGKKPEMGPAIPELTIYEPQTAVTALAWNPNLQVGGWIVAGMASGLVRIEDVGTD